MTRIVLSMLLLTTTLWGQANQPSPPKLTTVQQLALNALISDKQKIQAAERSWIETANQVNLEITKAYPGFNLDLDLMRVVADQAKVVPPKVTLPPSKPLTQPTVPKK